MLSNFLQLQKTRSLRQTFLFFLSNRQNLLLVAHDCRNFVERELLLNTQTTVFGFVHFIWVLWYLLAACEVLLYCKYRLINRSQLPISYKTSKNLLPAQQKSITMNVWQNYRNHHNGQWTKVKSDRYSSCCMVLSANFHRFSNHSWFYSALSNKDHCSLLSLICQWTIWTYANRRNNMIVTVASLSWSRTSV